MSGFVGKAPLTLVRTTAGRTVYVYEGDPYPADAADGEAKRHLAKGAIAKAAAEPEPQPEGEATGGTTGGAAEPEPEKPQRKGR